MIFFINRDALFNRYNCFRLNFLQCDHALARDLPTILWCLGWPARISWLTYMTWLSYTLAVVHQLFCLVCHAWAVLPKLCFLSCPA
jgi:hypothetical protein